MAKACAAAVSLTHCYELDSVQFIFYAGQMPILFKIQDGHEYGKNQASASLASDQVLHQKNHGPICDNSETS